MVKYMRMYKSVSKFQKSGFLYLNRLTRRVGSDGLLVAWTTPQDPEITGFQVAKLT